MTFNGIGYKCAIAGNKITLSLGLSHPVSIEIPEGLTVTNPTANEIVVSGIDNEKVGQFAADIKALKDSQEEFSAAQSKSNTSLNNALAACMNYIKSLNDQIISLQIEVNKLRKGA